nr:helix-turn-helix domain-containing protein [Bacteroides intestinalis]
MGEEFQTMTEKLDRIERLSLIAAKPVLLVEEAAIFTGFSVQHLYRLTSTKQIPHYKKDRKLYFKKSELEEWMLEHRVQTNEEIERQAEQIIRQKRR